MVAENFTHFLCIVLLFARLGDLVTTYLATPRLVLEANPLARRLGWRFGVATLAVCIVPYFNTSIAVGIVVPSLLVSAGNASRVWFTRALGEEAHLELLRSAARRSKLSHALAGVWTSALFMAAVGGLVALFYPTPRAWGFWIAAGILTYALAIAAHGTYFTVRLFRTAGAEPESPRAIV
jgi:hypothetical protein